MSSEASQPYLNRYTDLGALIHIMETKKITLLNPSSWEDKNDVVFMEEYKKRTNSKSLLALCFSQRREMPFHHWFVFAKGSTGVCIRFNRLNIIEKVNYLNCPGLTFREVNYISQNSGELSKLKTEDLPFSKRYGYKTEQEFRIVYRSTNTKPIFEIPIDRECIQSVTLSPWVHPSIKESVRKLVRTMGEFKDLSVLRSGLITSSRWQAHGRNAKS